LTHGQVEHKDVEEFLSRLKHAGIEPDDITDGSLLHPRSLNGPLTLSSAPASEQQEKRLTPEVFSPWSTSTKKCASLVLQCHFDLGYESATSSSESEHLHYPLPETFLAPLAVVAVDRAPRPELLFR
jgi:hypothetical protein